MTEQAANPVLDRWHSLSVRAAAREILDCCGSRVWAQQLAARRLFFSLEELLSASDRIWVSLAEEDWRQAFDSHPRIGQRQARSASAASLAWSSQEQAAASSPDDAVNLALAEANRNYEDKFGRIFIVCAAGKSAEEILSLLNARLHNSAAAEWREAGEQQRQITQLRLRRRFGAD